MALAGDGLAGKPGPGGNDVVSDVVREKEEETTVEREKIEATPVVKRGRGRPRKVKQEGRGVKAIDGRKRGTLDDLCGKGNEKETPKAIEQTEEQKCEESEASPVRKRLIMKTPEMREKKDDMEKEEEDEETDSETEDESAEAERSEGREDPESPVVVNEIELGSGETVVTPETEKDIEEELEKAESETEERRGEPDEKSLGASDNDCDDCVEAEEEQNPDEKEEKRTEKEKKWGDSESEGSSNREEELTD